MDSTKKFCLFCGKTITKKRNKFCNTSCAASYNNKKFHKKKKNIKTCLNCGKEIYRTDNQYCDIKCFHEYQFKNVTLPKFYDGEISMNDTIKKILIFLFGEICSECNNGNKWNDKPLTLQVDHIDGNSDNNLPSNVRLLCPNCHSQTDTFCGGCSPKNTKRNKYLRKFKSKIYIAD